MHLWYPPESAIPSAPLMMWATSGGCFSSEAQIALSAVCDPTIETNQRPSVLSSRANASAVAEKPPALMVKRSCPALDAGVFGVYGVGREHWTFSFLVCVSG